MGGGGAAVSAIVDYPRGAIVGPGRVVRYERPRFVPMMFANCVLWLNAARGVSTVDAVMPQPTRIDLWTTVFNGSRTATRYTEGAAGVTLYGVSEPAAALGTQQNHTYSVRAELPWLGDPNGRYCAFLGGGGAEQVYLDVQNQTIAATAGNVSNAQFSGGVFTADCVSTSGPNVYLLTWTGAGSYNHAGNGARFVECTSFTVEQRNVSQWDDGSGLAHHVSQAAPGSRPLLGQRPGWPVPVIYGDGIDDYLQSAVWAWNQPATVCLAARLVSHVANGTLVDGVSTNSRRIYDAAGTAFQMYAGSVGPNTPSDLARHIIVAVFNGFTSTIYKDNVPVAGVCGGAPAHGITLFRPGAAAVQLANAEIGEVIGYNRAIAPAEVARVSRAMGQAWGVAVA